MVVAIAPVRTMPSARSTLLTPRLQPALIAIEFRSGKATSSGPPPGIAGPVTEIDTNVLPHRASPGDAADADVVVDAPLSPSALPHPPEVATARSARRTIGVRMGTP